MGSVAPKLISWACTEGNPYCWKKCPTCSNIGDDGMEHQIGIQSLEPPYPHGEVSISPRSFADGEDGKVSGSPHSDPQPKNELKVLSKKVPRNKCDPWTAP